MEIDQFIAALSDDERASYEALAEEAAAPGADPKALRSRLARLAVAAQKRLGEKPTPGPIIDAFSERHLPKQLVASEVPLARLAEALPYPLGLKVKLLLAERERREAGEPTPQIPYELCAVAGLTLRVAAAIGIQSYVRIAGAKDAAMNREVVDTLRAPADGSWRELAVALAKILGGREDAQLARKLHAALNSKVGIKGVGKVATALQELVSFRNDLIHGERLTEDASNRALDLLLEVVRAFGFLAEYDLLVHHDGKTFRTSGVIPEAIQNGGAELPEDELCLVHREGKEPPLSLYPLLVFHEGVPDGRVDFDEIFFLNAGTAERLSYIAYRYARHMGGQELGSYEAFKKFMAQIPTPPMPRDPLIDFSSLADFHGRLFVGREDVLAEISSFVDQRPSPYGVLLALPGMGKTAIMAALYGKHTSPPDQVAQSGHRWAFHFCMATDGRDSPVVAWRSLIVQVCDLFGRDRKKYLSNDLEELQERLDQLMTEVGSDLAPGEHLVLAIDALDEGIGGGAKDTVPAMLPEKLPEHVVVLVSYRVDEAGHNTRVEGQLSHIAAADRGVLETANPLAGLTRDNVAEFLARAAPAVRVPERTVEAVWRAATVESGGAADPFYLRFVADGIESGRVDSARAETVPETLDDAFDEMWMSLPTDREFLLHRLLCTLAIMREYGDDAMFTDLFAEDADSLTVDDIAALRAKAGKLLVYDGDRYGLFHDRFKRFLVGEQSNPIEAALGSQEAVVAKLRSSTIHELHGLFSCPAEAWEDPDSCHSLREYAFRHGVAHMLARAEPARAEKLLTAFAYAMARLELENGDGARPMAQDYEAVRAVGGLSEPGAFDAWEGFFREKTHILARGDEEWPADRILLQLGVEHADDSPVTSAAERWLDTGACDWLWLRRVPRPEQTKPSPLLRVFAGHKGNVDGAAVLADGRLLSWSDDHTLRLWDRLSGEMLASLAGHTDGVNGATVLADGRILSWSADKTLRLWDDKTGEPLITLDGHSSFVNGATILGNGYILSWSGDKTLRLWDGTTGEPLATLEGHSRGGMSAIVLSDGRILSWSQDNTPRLWDSSTGEFITALEGHSNSVYGATLLADGRILSWSGDKTLRLWDGNTAKPLGTLEGHSGGVHGAEILNDGHILSWSSDMTIRIWDAQTRETVAVLEGHSDPPCGATLLANDRVLSWSYDKTLLLWDSDTGRPLATLEGHTEMIGGATALSDGRILSWSVDGTLRIWDGNTGDFLAALEGHSGPVNGAIVLADGNILSWSRDGTLRLWTGSTGQALASHEGHSRGGLGAMVLADGRVLSWSRDHTLRLWDGGTGEALTTLAGHSRTVNGATVLPDGRILSWSRDETLRMWDGSTGAPVATLAGHSGEVTGAMILGNSSIVSCSLDKTLRLWDIATGDPLATIEGHSGGINGAMALDDGRILSWSQDATLRLWDGSTGKPLATLKGHSAGGLGATVLADGRILSWSWDRTLRLWDCSTGEPLTTLEGHSEMVNGGTELADGRILSWSADHTLRLWDGTTGKMLAVWPLAAAPVRVPEFWDARARATEQRIYRDGVYAEGASGFIGCLSPRSIIRWHGDGAWDVTCLQSSGSILATSYKQVGVFHIYHGNRRVSLAVSVS